MQGPCWQISVPLTAAWKKHTLSTLITDGVCVCTIALKEYCCPHQSVQDREAILERFLEGETRAVNEKNHSDAICYMGTFIPGLLWLNSAWGVEDWVKGGSTHLISFPPVVLITPLFSRHVPAGRPRDLSLVRLAKMPFFLTGFDCDPWIWRHLLCASATFFID